MSGLQDFEQPAKQWLADAMDAISDRADKGLSSVLELNIYGVEFELRLKPKYGADHCSKHGGYGFTSDCVNCTQPDN